MCYYNYNNADDDILTPTDNEFRGLSTFSQKKKQKKEKRTRQFIKIKSPEKQELSTPLNLKFLFLIQTLNCVTTGTNETKVVELLQSAHGLI